jgi:plasmid stability protein
LAVVTVRNLPDEVHRALRMRAADHGRSTEAEVRAILEEAVKPSNRLKLGSLLADIGRKAKLTDAEVDQISQRDRTSPREISFE